MKKNSRILVTGGSGLIGGAVVHALRSEGFESVMAPTSTELNLLNLERTSQAFSEEYHPEYVFHLAGRSAWASTICPDPGKMYFESTLMNLHVAEACRAARVKKVLCIASTKAFTEREAPASANEEPPAIDAHSSVDPYTETVRNLITLLHYYRESDNLDFAVALSPCVYGLPDRPYQNERNAPELLTLIKGFLHAAKTSSSLRLVASNISKDYLYRSDAAEALITVMASISGCVNIGSGNVAKTSDITSLLAEACNVCVELELEQEHLIKFPELNVDRLRSTGFRPRVTLEQGLKKTLATYTEQYEDSAAQRG